MRPDFRRSTIHGKRTNNTIQKIGKYPFRKDLPVFVKIALVLNHTPNPDQGIGPIDLDSAFELL
ncbi:hypothetical protein SDC9_150436 [bioreactor metagenome]|uniref:Uncharacterized protein n=1 Tax=bioreactor metagenome TaxID=1076179 RepID=A0A645EPC7_9ZZZZ